MSLLAWLSRSHDERKTEASRVIRRHPDLFPLVVHQESDCSPDITIIKFLVPHIVTISQFGEHLRKKLRASDSITLFSDGVVLLGTESMAAVYWRHRRADEFLYIQHDLQCRGSTTCRDLWNQRLFTDASVYCSDDIEQIFEVHRAVLAAASPVFEMLFRRSDASVDSTCQVRVEGSGLAVEMMLKLVYTGSTRDIESAEVSLVVELLALAHMYQIRSLVDYCCKQLLVQPSLDCIALRAQALSTYKEDPLVHSYWLELSQVIASELKLLEALISSRCFDDHFMASFARNNLGSIVAGCLNNKDVVTSFFDNASRARIVVDDATTHTEIDLCQALPRAPLREELPAFAKMDSKLLTEKYDEHSPITSPSVGKETACHSQECKQADDANAYELRASVEIQEASSDKLSSDEYTQSVAYEAADANHLTLSVQETKETHLHVEELCENVHPMVQTLGGFIEYPTSTSSVLAESGLDEEYALYLQSIESSSLCDLKPFECVDISPRQDERGHAGISDGSSTSLQGKIAIAPAQEQATEEKWSSEKMRSNVDSEEDAQEIQQLSVEMPVYEAMENFDGLEFSECGKEEGGYLIVSTGDRIVVSNFEPVPGHRANRFSHYLYGHLLDALDTQGWFPSTILSGVAHQINVDTVGSSP